MKKIILLTVCFIGLFLYADAQQVPQGMMYQAVARDVNGKVIADQPISLKITLFTNSEKGTVQYSETHTATTNQLGLFSLTIGAGATKRGAFSRVPWSSEEIWMEIAIDEKGGQAYKTLSQSKLLAVPYAFHAATASEVTGLSKSYNYRNGNSPGVPSQNWSLFGNSKSDPEKDKLGTTDCADLVLVTNNEERLRILCTGEILIDSDLDVGNDLNVQNNANIENDLTVQQNVEVNISGGNTIVHGDFSVVDGSNTNLTGNLNVDGTTDLNSDVSVNNGSNTNLTGNLNVDGTTDLNSDVSVNNGSNTNLTGNLNVDGTTDLNSDVSVNNGSNTNLTGNLNVDGTTDLNSDVSVNNGSTTNLTGILNVDGETSINNTFNVTNNNTTNLTGLLNVDGATSINNTLSVSNTTNLGSSLNVLNGAPTTLSGTLNVTGFTTLNNSFTVANGSTSLFTGPTTVNNTLTVNDNFFTTKCITGGSSSKVLLKFNPDVVNTSEGGFNNYPLQLSGDGATQGMAIRVNSWEPNRNFIAFFAGGEMRGRIENKNNFLFNTLSSKSNELIDYDPNDAQGTPTAGGDTLSQNAVDNVNNADTSVPTNGTTISEANTEEIVELIILAVDFIGNVVSFATSFTSILDPLDIFEAGVSLVVSTASLAAFIGFGVANVGVAYESGSGDYAEWLQKENIEEVMTFGDVVGVTGGKISKDCASASKFMVISAAPAVIGNMPSLAEEDNFETVAFMGQIPVKVRGEVHIGDYILPSGDNDGLAIAVSRDKMRAKDYGRIIGVAWEDWNEDERNKIFQMINTAVGINQNDLADMVDQMQVVMNQMQAAIQQVNPDYEGFVFDTNAKNVTLGQDISVSSSHSSNMEGYFDGKAFSNREELGLLVKEAMVDKAGIDLSEYPMVDKMLTQPGYAEAAKEHYSELLVEYLAMLENAGGK